MLHRQALLIIVSVLAAALIGLAVLYLRVVDPYLTVRTLSVEGVAQTESLREVQSAVEESLDGNLLTADIAAVRNAVEKLGWIKSAEVSRIWPDGIRVKVTRYRVVGIWDDGRLVSSDGVLYVGRDESIDVLGLLPHFMGDPSYAREAVSYLPQFDRVVARIGARVKSINVTFRGSWSVTFESDKVPPVTVELGRVRTGVAPVAVLAGVIDNFERTCRMMRGIPERIDARYPNAFAVKIPSEGARERWERSPRIR